MEKIIKIPYDVLEEMIMAYSFHNVSFFLKIKNYLYSKNYKQKCFFNDPKNQIIFNILCKWYNKYQSFPSLKEFNLLVEKMEEDKEIKILLSSMVEKYYNEDTSSYNEDNLVEETGNYIVQQRVVEAITLSQTYLENGNFEAIVDKVKDAVTVNLDKDLGISLKDFEQIRELLNKSNYDKNTLKLGFSSFDNILSVKSSEILCFAGLPGSGKSMILGDIGVKAFWEGKKVLMYSLENSSLRVFQRYLSNILKINSNEITADADGVVEKLKNKISETEGDIILKEYMSNQVCSNDLMAHINDLILYKKWKPDIIIVDYILLMRTNDKQMSNDNSYKYYKTVTEELRNIAKTFKVPLLTACQINREGQADNGGSKALLTAKNISESRGILDTVDYFITINQTVMEKKKNEMRLYLEKNRNEESGKLAKCKINYEHMTMWENAENS